MSLAFSYVPEVAANQPTPWFGLSERISQYVHGLWYGEFRGNPVPPLEIVDEINRLILEVAVPWWNEKVCES